MFHIFKTYFIIKQARQTIQDAIDAAESGVPMDMVQIDLTRTWEILGEIIGETASDELIISYSVNSA